MVLQSLALRITKGSCLLDLRPPAKCFLWKDTRQMEPLAALQVYDVSPNDLLTFKRIRSHAERIPEVTKSYDA